MTRRTRLLLVLGVALDALGLIWMLQGLNYLGGSFMTGDPFWARTGLALMVFATAILAFAFLGETRSSKR